MKFCFQSLERAAAIKIERSPVELDDDDKR
jgi:hypothetical protein